MMLLLALLALCEAAIASNIPNYTELTFVQVVDHFNVISNETFKQRYLVTEMYWTQGNSHALFFYTGNEGPIDQFWDNSGFVFEAAKNCNALVVFAEHRYYGQSLPFGNQSFNGSNVHYLNMEQAITDYAVLIEHLRQHYKFTRVITFGGSYGGQLSTYMRFKYPFIVDGALAASAPIFQVAGIVPGELFWNGVTMDYNMSNPMCPVKVREAFNQILEYRNSTAGLEKISKAFNLCPPINSSQDVDHLIGWIMNGFASLAMSDYPYATDFLAPLPAYPVNASCKMIMNGTDPLSGLAAGVGLFYNGGNHSQCSDIYKDYVECADPTGCGTGNEAKAWDYQACTELWMDGSTNNVSDMFPPHVYNSSSYCKQKWGVERRPRWVITEFWGKEIFSASNIFFSNGELDPWRQGGVLKSPNEGIITYLIHGGAHHLDLRSSNKDDPQSVNLARAKELEWIQKWIA